MMRISAQSNKEYYKHPGVLNLTIGDLWKFARYIEQIRWERVPTEDEMMRKDF